MMSYNSEVLGKITVAQRMPGEEHTDWTVRSDDTTLGNEHVQRLQNVGSTIGDIVAVKKVKPDTVVITVVQSDPATEAMILRGFIERFIRIVDRHAKQLRETPLARNSDVPVYGHHYQG